MVSGEPSKSLPKLWCDDLRDDITRAVVADIRANGFKCWRTGLQVWVNTADFLAMATAGVKTGFEPELIKGKP